MSTENTTAREAVSKGRSGTQKGKRSRLRHYVTLPITIATLIFHPRRWSAGLVCYSSKHVRPSTWDTIIQRFTTCAYTGCTYRTGDYDKVEGNGSEKDEGRSIETCI